MLYMNVIKNVQGFGQRGLLYVYASTSNPRFVFLFQNFTKLFVFKHDHLALLNTFQMLISSTKICRPTREIIFRWIGLCETNMVLEHFG